MLEAAGLLAPPTPVVVSEDVWWQFFSPPPSPPDSSASDIFTGVASFRIRFDPRYKRVDTVDESADDGGVDDVVTPANAIRVVGENVQQPARPQKVAAAVQAKRVRI